MDAKIKKCCPNCSQFYHLKSLSKRADRNIPLLLKCGHTMCENCIKNIIKFGEPIQCKVCLKDMEMSAADVAALLQNSLKFYQLFPVQTYMLGEIALDIIQPTLEGENKNNQNYFEELETILQGNEVQAQCLECNNPTIKGCKECGTTLCNVCFNKIHRNFVIFKNHSLQNIENLIKINTCNTHSGKPLDYYCKDCNKTVCMDCMIIGEKSCKNHAVVSMQEVNEDFLKELTDITPKLDETYRRLTKTAVDIGNLMNEMENESGASEFTNIINNVQQHFSKLISIIQEHKNKVMDEVLNLQSTEKKSLENIKNEVTKSLKAAQKTLHSVKSIDEKNLGQTNLYSILEETKKYLDVPWYLSKDDKNEDPLKLTVNEDLLGLLNDYIHLEGSAKCQYKLLSTEALTKEEIDIPPPPRSVVHPPEMPKDVRQYTQNKMKQERDRDQKHALYTKVPQYRSKSGSCSSLNSINSDNSNPSHESSGRHNKAMVQEVSPFPESRHPKPLKEGSQELIYVTHIVDAHNFFVQRACQIPQVQEMQRELRKASTMPKPAASHVAEGKFYLVFNKADDMWQRCRVVSIEKNDMNKLCLKVFCIDFGSTEEVSVDDLRLLPPARLQKPSPFVINCSLANCEPLNGQWTNEDAFLMQDIIDNKPAVINIRRIRSKSNYSVTYECDITTYENGVSLAHAMVFHQRAKMPNPKLPYPNIICGAEKPTLYVNHNDFKAKTVEEVYITHIVNPDQFYVRKNHVQRIYEKLSQNLEQEYNWNSKTRYIYLPEVGMVCAVHVERVEPGGARWARGVVRELTGRGRVRVFLPDVGGSLVLPWTALRRLALNFTTIQALATECHLAGITTPNKSWSNGSIALFKCYGNRLLDLYVEDNKNSHSLGVSLYDKTDMDNVICVNEELIKQNFAIPFGIFMFNQNRYNQIIRNQTSFDYKTNRKKKAKNDSIQILKKPQPKIEENDMKTINKGPLRLEIKILHYQSPSLFYVSLIHQQKTFNELFDKIQTYYSEKKDGVQEKVTWQVGDRCCAMCTQSQTWRRAVILELDGDTAKLFYTDFACIETAPIATMRELTEDFASIGDATFKCHLSGVIPAVGEEWPSLTKEFLKELIDAYKRFFITKVGDFKDKSMPVELWVYHTIQGDALEPNTSEWRCLNKKIVEQGLGIPDKKQDCDPSNIEKNSDENSLSFLNITGSVNEWLQLDQLPLRPLPKNKMYKQDSASSIHSSSPIDPAADTETKDEEVDMKTIFISDWLPPEPLTNNEFIGKPTYINDDGILYIHSIDQEDTLNLIKTALNVRFKDADPKAKFTKWTVGDPCIALFYLDNLFYRGKVLKVNEEESTCLILYIDYGNEEICSFTNLRKSIALHQIPIQAHKCVLDRIRPVETKWERQSLDYIHKCVVENKCFVKVTGQAVNGVTPIELKFDKLWLNEHLVEFKMAVYLDGTETITKLIVPAIDNTVIQEVSSMKSNDSGPDYIVVDENQSDKSESDVSQSDDSFNLETFKDTDWNQLVEDEEKQMDQNVFLFPKQDTNVFSCNILTINDTSILELTILHDDYQETLYEEMLEEIQKKAANMSPLKGIFENKACIAVFSEDRKWYRASILEYSKEKNLVKVKFVDYGNIEIVRPGDIKEITEEYLNIPPGTVSARLYGVKVNPDVEIKVITQEYTKTFLGKGPFQCKIVNYDDSIPQVELRNKAGELVYDDLVKKDIFILN